ncbi:ion transporter [Coniochaeta ligniaria NRRL 30616]|uniref:Calcium-channel protein CCH1 n=1 Tax=Coniochaeta ligniaria NRRL 30616 TaxID=1408157 RepID=A0A1J7JZW0_9PEZI|nr:ion transporter [Coniochaeta ligniaria NRRL 30616]
MDNTHNSNQPSGPPPQSIPLRNLQRPPDSANSPYQDEDDGVGGAGLSIQYRQPHVEASSYGHSTSEPTAAQMSANLPGISSYWEHPYQHPHDDGDVSPNSPIDHMALQFALPPDIGQRDSLGPPQAMSSSSSAYIPPTPYYEEAPDTDSIESDRVPLRQSAQPIGTLEPPENETQPRDSFHTVSDMDNSPVRPRNTQLLGFDLENQFVSGGRPKSYGDALTPEGGKRRSRSPSTSGALSRAGTIMRAMSQRVVAISGEGDLIERQEQRDRSRSPSADGRKSHHVSAPMLVDTSYPSQVFQGTPTEKKGELDVVIPEDPSSFFSRPRARIPNPLKGKSLGIFGPENRLRKWLCDLLVNPWTEPIILLLIILQAVLLAIEAAPNVFKPGNERPERWGSTRIDWAIFGLFVFFTVELIARIIVSGLVVNAPEYRAADRKRGVRERVAEQYRQIFRPQRQKSVKRPPQEFTPTFARSFTRLQGQALPETLEEQQRLHLARRAFLRHGFNRLDFVAVVSFWISFVLGVTGLEKHHHLFLFRMLSCLRILRLLALTKGNAIILRSLKRAAPLLVRVSFLIGFFWLVFAIVGVQSFKSSLSRQCVWLDPQDPTNITASYSPDMSFCGGYLDNVTGESRPWVYAEIPGTLIGLKDAATNSKGHLCPRGSVCLQSGNPYNGTVNFDNIVHSLELVFVIMSANTFSDLMYYTTDSDYLPAALFFGAGIMIMMLWMTNLLIAVITSVFQVIREENKASAFTADQTPARPHHSEAAKNNFGRQSTLQQLYTTTSWFWVIIIAFGLFAQSFRSARMSATREVFINTAEIAITIALDVEIVLRIIADFRGFHRKLHNLVDLGLAVITSVILIPPIRNSGQVYAWLTVFQILRSYRIVLYIPMTRRLIELVLGNVSGIANLMLFVFLMTFLMAIFAAQLFRGEIPSTDADGNFIQVPFSDIYNSFLGMYQILSSENWTSILYNVTSYTTSLQMAWVGAIFLIAWFILSFFILINMFIAVIQENFDISDDEKRLRQIRAYVQQKELGTSTSSHLTLSQVLNLGRSNKRKDPTYGDAVLLETLLKEAVMRKFLNESLDPDNDVFQESPNPNEAKSPPLSPPRPVVAPGILETGIVAWIWSKTGGRFISKDPNPFYSTFRLNDNPNGTDDPREMAHQAYTATYTRRKAQREYLARHPMYNTSLFIFRPKNPIRRLCQKLVPPARGHERIDGVEVNSASYVFQGVIYAAIVAMVILACVTTPLYQREYFKTHDFSPFNWFVLSDLAFAILFTVEACIKVIADGFLFAPNAFYRSSWGIIDGIVMITLWINIITLFTNDGAVSRAVGAFKALRALRLLNVSNSARQTFHSLIIISGWKILSAAFVSIALLIPFALYGLNLFNGKMMSCNDGGNITELVDCFGEYNNTPFSGDWNVLSPRVASNPWFSFDDFGSSLFILFQIVSQEGWVDVSFAAQAISGRGLQPQDGVARGNAMFFVAFNLLATVFILTLFISVFMRNYTEQTGVAFLTTEQRSWLEMKKLLRQISPSKTSYDDSKNKWKKWCHKRAIEKRGKWYLSITGVLVLHLILLLSEFYLEPVWWTRTRDIAFLVFTLIYIANITIRIFGLGWSRFRRSSWDVFSVIAVTGAFATSILFLTQTNRDTYIQLHKFFLVAIVLLLIPRNDALDQLFKTAAASLSTIGNLLATWLVFFLVFAIALTQTFSLTRFGQNEQNNINFRSVPNALILLFRMSCGEGWNQVMEDYAQVMPPFCVESSSFYDSDCGSTAWARVLFIAWNIISMYIFVNLFVSLIYESFSYVYQRSNGLSVVDRDEIRRFKEAWRSVDPQGTGWISKETFPRLLGELSGVFEMRIYDHGDSVRQILEDIRGDDAMSVRHQSIASVSQLQTGLDLKKLNARLNQIDRARVQKRRHRFALFYEEIMCQADPERGVSFTHVLMTLAHYNIIDENALKLDSFLHRQNLMGRIQDEINRRTVVNFFEMMRVRIKFKAHMARKHSSRMTGIPQMDVPEIFIENEEDRANREAADAANNNNHDRPGISREPTSETTIVRSPTSSALSPTGNTNPFLSASEAHAQHRSWTGVPADLSAFDSFYGPDEGHQGHRTQASAFSFELHEPEAGGGGGSSNRSSRRGSTVRPEQVTEMLNSSVWMDSIRRSATMRRPQGGSEGAWGGFNQWQ